MEETALLRRQVFFDDAAQRLNGHLNGRCCVKICLFQNDNLE